MSGAYYNENDPHAAAWLRELIRRGLIADGEVDTRSIEDVLPIELRGYTQCHFFAGIGGWSYALRLAGWPDDERIWTGSCPCQPFSNAGQGAGFADQRHLWPAWLHLISQCQPAVIVGEQVASAAALLWWDLVSADLEGQGYACAAADLCAAGVGAPHIRQRLYWVADASSSRLEGCDVGALGHECATAERGGGDGGLADSMHAQRRPINIDREDGRDRANAVRQEACGDAGARNEVCDSDALHGFWRAADWLGCRDGKWRPVEPGTFPLVARVSHGVVRGGNSSAPINPSASTEGRVMRLRGYGNAIVPQVAAEFVATYLDARAVA